MQLWSFAEEKYLGRSIVYSVKLSSEMFQRHVRIFIEIVISFYPSRDLMYNNGSMEGLSVEVTARESC
jgi:hypothetical protein